MAMVICPVIIEVVDPGEGPGGGGGGLFSDRTDARRAEKKLWRLALPLISGSG